MFGMGYQGWGMGILSITEFSEASCLSTHWIPEAVLPHNHGSQDYLQVAPFPGGTVPLIILNLFDLNLKGTWHYVFKHHLVIHPNMFVHVYSSFSVCLELSMLPAD